MKKIIFLSLFLLGSLVANSQSGYPKLDTDSNGIKVVIFTIDQAQKIDNNLELFNLLSIANIKCDSISTVYIKVIDNLKNQVAVSQMDINQLKMQIKDKDSQIENLQLQLENIKKSDKLCDSQKLLKDNEIALLKKEVRKQKFRKAVGYIVGSIGTIGGVLLAILL